MRTLMKVKLPLLLAAMLISLLLGEISDAIAVFAIVVLNTLLGFFLSGYRQLIGIKFNRRQGFKEG